MGVQNPCPDPLLDPRMYSAKKVCLVSPTSILYTSSIMCAGWYFAASDLVLRCLSMSHKKDARLIWVN